MHKSCELLYVFCDRVDDVNNETNINFFFSDPLDLVYIIHIRKNFSRFFSRAPKRSIRAFVTTDYPLQLALRQLLPLHKFLQYHKIYEILPDQNNHPLNVMENAQ